MVNRLTSFLSNKRYLSASLGLAILFLVLAIYVRRDIYRQTESRANEMAVNISANNINIVKARLLRYTKYFDFFQGLNNLSIHTQEDYRVALNHFLKLDSTIIKAWFYTEETGLVTTDNNSLDPFEELQRKGQQDSADVDGPLKDPENNPVISLSRELQWNENQTARIGFYIDLITLHNYFSEVKDFKSAYLYIITPDMRCIYHPDEKKIGQFLEEQPDMENIQRAFSTREQFLGQTHSQYLDIDIYRYYYPFKMSDEDWLITANVPNLEFTDYINKTERSLLLITILPLIFILVVFILGILNWQKEFVQRKETENQNLNLLLKNEQQKKEAISAQLEILKSGLNPHFLFNSLSALMVLVKREPLLAREFARSLSLLYRYLLTQEKKDTVTLREELDFALHYIKVQNIRFKDSIMMLPTVDDQFMECKVPPISLQTLVENCIKHNASLVAKPLVIKIFIEEGYVVVENNLNPRHSTEESTAKGQANLISRYALLTSMKCSFEKRADSYRAAIPLLT